MRSSIAFALISFNVACWTTIAVAEDTTQAATDKGGKIVATAPRHVDITHGVSTIQDRTGAAVIANLRSAAATAHAIEHRVVSASVGLIGAGAVTVGGGHAASAATTVGAAAYGGPPAIGATLAATKFESTFSLASALATSGTGTDRTGIVAALGSVQTATARPMGMSAAAGNFATVSVRPDATGVVAAGVVLGAAAVANGKTGLSRGVESTNVRATVLADVPSNIALTLKPTGVTPRAVGVWNSATSMGGAVQRARPNHTKR